MGAPYERGTPLHRNQEIKSQHTSWPAIAQEPLKPYHSSQELIPREPFHVEICCAADMLVPLRIDWNLRRHARTFPQCVVRLTDAV